MCYVADKFFKTFVILLPMHPLLLLFNRGLVLNEGVFNTALQNTFFFMWRCGPTRARTSSFLRFLDHTQRRITVGRTPLDE